ncbi:hypothetical protein [Streptomyces ziwulingensis]|uniref:Uncharacterized protein n=1 Tax=Streptomyces ziwulingensis TaxID=1045501 RepID=A0ABP9C0U3_9ACTN
MAPKNDHLTPPQAARQLRRTRTFYAAGIALWTVSTAWTGLESPGSGQMWASALLLAVFVGLLLTASLWARRLDRTGPRRPAHHAAPRRTATPRHAGLRTH